MMSTKRDVVNDYTGATLRQHEEDDHESDDDGDHEHDDDDREWHGVNPNPALHRLIVSGEVAYYYDARGNVAHRSDDRTLNLTYNATSDNKVYQQPTLPTGCRLMNPPSREIKDVSRPRGRLSLAPPFFCVKERWEDPTDHGRENFFFVANHLRSNSIVTDSRGRMYDLETNY